MDSLFVSYVVGIITLLFCSGFFSGSETGLTASNRARIHKLKLEGNKRAKQVSYLHEREHQLLSAILLGNNLVNILASALATSLMITLFGEQGVVFATVIMTLLVLVFAEVLPKSYALMHSERVALRVAPVLVFLVRVFSPVTLFVEWLVRRLMWLLRVDMNVEISGKDEIKGAIELQHHEGTVQKSDRDMLGGVLDLEQVTVEDIMVHRKDMIMIDADLPVSQVVDQLLGSVVTRIPLWKDDPDNIVGVLHSKDLFRAVHQVSGKEVLDVNVLDIASEPWFIPDTTPVGVQLQAFKERRSHFALVVDEYGALQGLVTLEDVLEEIVGEIVDEHDTEGDGITHQKDGWYYLDGRVTIRDLNRRLDWRLPEEDASTIAGLVIHQAGVIPDVGEIFEFHGVIFEIHEKLGNQITGIRVKAALR